MFPNGVRCTAGAATSKAALMGLSPKLVRSHREPGEVMGGSEGGYKVCWVHDSIAGLLQ